MIEAFLSGGVLMWPLLVIGAGVLVLGARTGWLFARSEGAPPEAERALQSILFWGGMSLVLGLLGTVVGIVQIAQAVALAGAVEARLIWGGFEVSLMTLIFGLLILMTSLLLWIVLRGWRARLVA
ncbi:hypothetical protein BH23GEM6_BH23GEM6_18600 [soil metagenome]